MTEIYNVSVRVSLLANGVSSALLRMTSQFRGAEFAAAGLRKELKGIGTTLLVGTGLTVAGLGIFGVLEKTMKAGSDYAAAINRMNMAGLSQVEVAEGVAAAWKNTGDVLQTTATQNISSLLDLRNILGSMKDAEWALPIVSKLGVVFKASNESAIHNNAQDFSFAMAKALDIIGAARNPQLFEHEAGLMSKVITAFQGRVTPAMYQSVFQYARQAKFDMSDEFKYQLGLPTLMLEMSRGNGGAGGGSRGVGPMISALYRFTNQGYVSKKAIPELERLGLLTDHNYARTATTGVVGVHIKDAALAAQNSFLWTQNVLGPSIVKAIGERPTDPAKEAIWLQSARSIVNQLTAGNQLAGNALTEYLTKPQNFYRDAAIAAGAMPYSEAYVLAASKNPETVFDALKAQWASFLTTVGLQVTNDAITIAKSLTPAIHDLAIWAQKNPNAIKGWVRGFEMLATALTIGGGATVLYGTIRLIGMFAGAVPIAAAGIVDLASAITPLAILPIPAITAGFQTLSAAVVGLGLAPLAATASGLLLVAGAIATLWLNAKLGGEFAKTHPGGSGRASTFGDLWDYATGRHDFANGGAPPPASAPPKKPGGPTNLWDYITGRHDLGGAPSPRQNTKPAPPLGLSLLPAKAVLGVATALTAQSKVTTVQTKAVTDSTVSTRNLITSNASLARALTTLAASVAKIAVSGTGGAAPKVENHFHGAQNPHNLAGYIARALGAGSPQAGASAFDTSIVMPQVRTQYGT